MELSDDQYVEREFHYIFTDPHTGGYDYNNQFYDVNIRNCQPKSQKQPCDFCKNVHTDDCLFNFEDESITIDNVLGMISNERELELVIQWKSNAKINFGELENRKYKSVKLDSCEKLDDF